MGVGGRKAQARILAGRLGNVTLQLPFVSIAVNPKDRERQVARELVIRLRDRRVLSAWECCDDCIDRAALTSLQEIRQILVNKQVELFDVSAGPLYLLIDAMALGIRQFLTFEEILKRRAPRYRSRAVSHGAKLTPTYLLRLDLSWEFGIGSFWLLFNECLIASLAS